jgi:hypothetical protein
MKDLEPLWKIEDELTALIDSVDVCPPEQKPELEARIAQYVGAEIEKVDRMGAVLSSLDGVARNAKAEIARLSTRQQSAERAVRQLEEYMLRMLRAREGRPLKGHNVTFSVRRTEAVIIEDLNLIPDRYKRVTLTTDVPKMPIKDAIQAGQKIPGARIEQHEHLVRR